MGAGDDHGMEALDLARWQFALTTIYHFLFIPLSIGLSVLVAGMQTAWHRTGKAKYLRLTKFWGRLFLINFAMGVVTGIIQEFQFGMNWSEYSRFVGDVFGAPLAVEALLAFFLESTFLGLWVFGWGRLPRRVHLATIWLAAIGSTLSAVFILMANSWMRNPVGYQLDPSTGRAQLTDIVAVLTNPTALLTVPHVLASAFVTAGVFVVGVSAWFLLRRRDTELFYTSLRAGLVVSALAAVTLIGSGDMQGKLMASGQPMKLAAAEALWEDQSSAGLSLVSIPAPEGGRNIFEVKIPYGLSIMATNSPTANVEGINDIQRRYEQRFGPGDYRPNVPVIFWSFRVMVGFGMLVAGLSVVGLWFTRRRRVPAPEQLPDGRLRRWLLIGCVAAMPAPLLASVAGWLLTEMGRQPWTVFGLFQTAQSVSPGVTVTAVAVSLAIFTLLYGALALIEGWLMVRSIKAGPPDAQEALLEIDGAHEEDEPLSEAASPAY